VQVPEITQPAVQQVPPTQVPPGQTVPLVAFASPQTPLVQLATLHALAGGGQAAQATPAVPQDAALWLP